MKRVVTEYITDALFELLKTKELNKITIFELIQKAGVCRSSFYRNYFLLEDVLKKYLNELFKEITGSLPIDLGKVAEHSEHVYTELLKYRERLSLLEKRGLLYLLDDAIYSGCENQIRKLKATANEYKVCFYTGASSFIIRTWVKNGFKETPRELVIFTIDSLLPNNE